MLKSEMFDKGKVFCKISIGLCLSFCFSERYYNVVTEQATVKEVRDQIMIILLCSQYDNIYIQIILHYALLPLKYLFCTI